MCSSGYVDIVTPEELIEVKRAQLWKGGMGQVLAYSKDFPGLRPRLHLFGAREYDHFALARTTCLMFGVELTTEGGGLLPAAAMTAGGGCCGACGICAADRTQPSAAEAGGDTLRSFSDGDEGFRRTEAIHLRPIAAEAPPTEPIRRRRQTPAPQKDFDPSFGAVPGGPIPAAALVDHSRLTVIPPPPPGADPNFATIWPRRRSRTPRPPAPIGAFASDPRGP